jgi:RNA polymerase sigma-70 factor (ECF subfamily)
VHTDVENVDVAAMLRLRDGDDLALNQIIDRWEKRVVSYLLRLTGDATVACDLAEETFVRVYQSRERYRPTGAFSTWLFSIATNLFRDLARWRSRHATISMDAIDIEDGKPLSERIADSRPDAAAALETAERAAAVRSAVLSLPEDQRQAVVLSEYEGLSHQEIGEVMGCTAKAVEARLYRARAELRIKLKALLP